MSGPSGTSTSSCGLTWSYAMSREARNSWIRPNLPAETSTMRSTPARFRRMAAGIVGDEASAVSPQERCGRGPWSGHDRPSGSHVVEELDGQDGIPVAIGRVRHDENPRKGEPRTELVVRNRFQ